MENFLRNEQIADLHQIRGEVLPVQDNTLFISQKERLFCNLIQSFYNSQIKLQKKILSEFQVFFKDEFISTYAVKNSNVLSLLLQQIENGNEELQFLSIIALERIMRYRVAKIQFFEKDGYDIILNKLDSESNKIRYNAQKIFYNISKEQDLVRVLHKNNFIKYLIDIFAIEEVPIHQILLNRTLSNFLYQNDIITVFVSYSIEDVLMEVSLSSTFDVLNCSLKNFLLLSYSKQGKECLIKSKIYQKYFKIFSYYHENFSSIEQPKINHCDIDFIFQRIEMRNIRNDANNSFCSFVDFDKEDQMDETLFINFFASTCQSIESKNFYAEYYAHELIINYLSYEQKEDSIILACALFLTNLAEHQKVRKELQQNIEQINNLFEQISLEYKEFIDEMFKVINWKPQLISYNYYNLWKFKNFYKFWVYMSQIKTVSKTSKENFNNFIQNLERINMFFQKQYVYTGVQFFCMKKDFIHEIDQIVQKHNSKIIQDFVIKNKKESQIVLQKFKDCLQNNEQQQICYQNFQESILNFENKTIDLIKNKLLQLITLKFHPNINFQSLLIYIQIFILFQESLNNGQKYIWLNNLQQNGYRRRLYLIIKIDVFKQNLRILAFIQSKSICYRYAIKLIFFIIRRRLCTLKIRVNNRRVGYIIQHRMENICSS